MPMVSHLVLSAATYTAKPQPVWPNSDTIYRYVYYFPVIVIRKPTSTQMQNNTRKSLSFSYAFRIYDCVPQSERVKSETRGRKSLQACDKREKISYIMENFECVYGKLCK